MPEVHFMKRPQCRSENSEKAKFCRKCGESLQPELTCTHCHHRNIPDSRFCEQCGKPLVSDQTLSTQTGPQYVQSTELAPEPVAFAGGRYQVCAAVEITNPDKDQGEQYHA